MVASMYGMGAILSTRRTREGIITGALKRAGKGGSGGNVSRADWSLSGLMAMECFMESTFPDQPQKAPTPTCLNIRTDMYPLLSSPFRSCS